MRTNDFHTNKIKTTLRMRSTRNVQEIYEERNQSE